MFTVLLGVPFLVLWQEEIGFVIFLLLSLFYVFLLAFSDRQLLQIWDVWGKKKTQVTKCHIIPSALRPVPVLPFLLWSQYSYVCFIQCPGFAAVLRGNDRGKLRLPHLPRNRSGLSIPFEVKIRNLIKQGNCIYYVEETPSSRSKSLHEINFKCLSNNLKENFKNVPWYLIHKKTNLQGICLNVLKNYSNDFSSFFFSR